MPGGLVINAAVEGIVDEAVVRRLVQHVGAIPGEIYGRKGKQSLRQKIHGYNNAARRNRWIILVDLDKDAKCAPLLRAQWLGNPAPLLLFRIAVRKVEAWLLADRTNIALFL
ncbi:MAG: hypothetical protein KatS3mg110_0480 [Pirellulaceae bacterium]|nr:MAG: hypothetical protein KatS3mg110_0470 [Pirellulaceae bacterium]GIW92439.1 MAG: hypothetical protein KatS3mg110_0480 [Pirellulaceae bacterium]